jgi:small subunit ribosomal protein S2
VDYVIPANDDASKSIDKVLSFVTDAIAEGLSDRKADKEKVKDTKEVAAPETEEVAPKAETPKVEEAKVEETKAEDTNASAEEKK